MNEEERMTAAPEAEQSAQQGGAQESAAAQEALAGEVRALYQDGWPIEQLQALAGDEQAREQLARGASLRQAATAFLMRRADAGRNLPQMTGSAYGAAKNEAHVSRMSDAEFAQWFVNVYTTLYSWPQKLIYSLPASVINLMTTAY